MLLNTFPLLGLSMAVKCTPGMIPGETPLLDRIPLAFGKTPVTKEEVLEVCKEINVY